MPTILLTSYTMLLYSSLISNSTRSLTPDSMLLQCSPISVPIISPTSYILLLSSPLMSNLFSSLTLDSTLLHTSPRTTLWSIIHSMLPNSSVLMPPQMLDTISHIVDPHSLLFQYHLLPIILSMLAVFINSLTPDFLLLYTFPYNSI